MTLVLIFANLQHTIFGSGVSHELYMQFLYIYIYMYALNVVNCIVQNKFIIIIIITIIITC